MVKNKKPYNKVMRFFALVTKHMPRLNKCWHIKHYKSNRFLVGAGGKFKNKIIQKTYVYNRKKEESEQSNIYPFYAILQY